MGECVPGVAAELVTVVLDATYAMRSLNHDNVWKCGKCMLLREYVMGLVVVAYSSHMSSHVHTFLYTLRRMNIKINYIHTKKKQQPTHIIYTLCPFNGHYMLLNWCICWLLRAQSRSSQPAVAFKLAQWCVWVSYTYVQNVCVCSYPAVVAHCNEWTYVLCSLLDL